MIQERLSALREEMKKRKIDIYIVPTADFHESEYVGEHFKARKFITGFTGSAGTAVITPTEAGLWTLFCTGGKTACWKYRDALPHGGRGCADGG